MADDNLESANVLLIEPSKLYQQIVAQQLEKVGLSVSITNSGKKALAIAKKSTFLLILCANELPDYEGVELATELRKYLGIKVPLLLLTSSDDKKLIRKALERDVTEVIIRDRLVEMRDYISSICKEVQQNKKQSAHILFIEDSEAIAMQTEKFFLEQGYQVTQLTNAEGALALFNEQSFDLIITDILLEGKMTGMGLIRHVRNLSEPICKLPIIAISGLDKASQRIEALRQGATDFISKPMDNDELVVRAKNLIRAKKLHDKVLEQEKQLRLLAITDPLTELYNRHYLTDIGIKRVKEAQRHGHALSIIVIDLDFFKSINDNHGHSVGDMVLKEVSQLLIKSCRREDFAVRFGGEEFVLVLPHCNIKNSEVKAKKICQELAELKPGGLNLTASLGVAGKDSLSEEDSFNYLFHQADSAVYYAKEHGRNQVCMAQTLKN
ncbi:diguanylate cyclase [Aliikangiella sp. IMCC44359]|uniref:diguanylate cyclase n=1 Tax=Aliikangiella sp. IMCC44359 TaxID=3459125 RepID=UPI00403B2EF6